MKRKTMQDLADELGISRKYIRSFLGRMGVHKLRVYAILDKNLATTDTAIRKQTGLNWKTVRKHRMQYYIDHNLEYNRIYHAAPETDIMRQKIFKILDESNEPENVTVRELAAFAGCAFQTASKYKKEYLEDD